MGRGSHESLFVADRFAFSGLHALEKEVQDHNPALVAGSFSLPDQSHIPALRCVSPTGQAPQIHWGYRGPMYRKPLSSVCACGLKLEER